jgi:predicted nucleic acid-binding protein
MFVLDTNILIYHAAGKEDSAMFFDAHSTDVLYVPSIVVAEFLSYPLISEKAVSAFRSFISQMIIVNLDFRIAELAAEIRRTYRVKLLDAVVAATAFSTNSILVTKNMRDFKKIKELQLF